MAEMLEKWQKSLNMTEKPKRAEKDRKALKWPKSLVKKPKRTERTEMAKKIKKAKMTEMSEKSKITGKTAKAQRPKIAENG